ncbi:zinc-binding alcohol dehydrogenase family protein [Weissella viridescens]|uniref:Zinc-binding alcohol dehydrogenase family protein n=1 Tax=Weissella viridescens TaxID=1629 RepID=A0A3P2RDT4_WEIVI|nr:zinc-binding alcohol dehydrogenase family protein [Weissella viridescens]RRG18777.1 zinc-binding alcohol dehydrogenase family protein [Weissella viridescens]
MKVIKQVNFDGIDGLKLEQIPVPELTPDSVMVKMAVLPVVPTDWKRESSAHATREAMANLPKVIGTGGVGTVTQVGANRDQALLGKRVLVMQPAGAYAEYVRNEKPEWLFCLPDSVASTDAATLIAGAGTALRVAREIEADTRQNVILTGANSVIGLYLIQLLQMDNYQGILYPIVSTQSQAYFDKELPSQTCYTVEQLPQQQDAILVDIAGSEQLLERIIATNNVTRIVSIAIMESERVSDIEFIHESFAVKDYNDLIEALADKTLKAPVGRIFKFEDTIAAQHFAKENHSRGRVLVEF